MKIYDFLARHASLRWASLIALTSVLLVSLFRLSYKEDILDFLPISETDRERMAVYQDISGMNRLFVVFENGNDTERTTEAIGKFVEEMGEASASMKERIDLRATLDPDSIMETLNFVYANMPFFLSEDDFERMDSLLSLPGFVDDRLAGVLEALLLPSGGNFSEFVSRDPLGLFSPVPRLLQSGTEARFQAYDGYFFSPDMKRAFVMLASPFGSSETKMNAQLVALTRDAIQKMQSDFPDIEAHVVGAPQVAVGNAQQIVRDSCLAVSLSAILILALLLYAFRRVRDILLICLSVGWGWLFALGGMALARDSVSMIVVGISSIIMGIAVNYPLHLIGHVRHQPDPRLAVREIATPLLVGNITTVGAFLTLVPLGSLALRDLGLFAALLLVGTILFVLIWLPHLMSCKERMTMPDGEGADLLTRLASIRMERKPWVAVIVAVLTLFFGYYSFSVEFDADVSNINYMSEEQKAEMAMLTGAEGTDSISLYLLSSAPDFDEALVRSESLHAKIDSLRDAGLTVSQSGVSRFLPSMAEQAVRLRRWQKWVEGHPELLGDLDAAASKYGFAEDAFSEFKDIIQSDYAPHPFEYFCPLTSQVFAGNISHASKGKATIAEILTVRKEDADEVKKALPEAFDIPSLNAAIANSLTNEFNYLGWVCAAVVFFFLWLSFRSIKLAVISFIPMAVSWIWILGIMAILDIRFNIVNIILATFIFGQGDDYTIFMTEGCISEYEKGKPVLVSYKRSIILSALIMFIGIGSLIFARHPALHSLAEITIIGMFSVVLMAYLIPPLLYGWFKGLKIKD